MVLGKGEARMLHLRQERLDHSSWQAIGDALADELGIDRNSGLLIGMLLACEAETEAESILLRRECWALPIEAQRRLPDCGTDRVAAGVDAHPHGDLGNDSASKSQPAGIVRGERTSGASTAALRRSDAESRRSPSSIDPSTHAAEDDAAVDIGEGPARHEAFADEGTTGALGSGSAAEPAEAEQRGPAVFGPAQAGRGAGIRSSPSAPRPRRQARLGTYAEADAPPRDELLIQEVDAAATRLVMQYEREQGRTPVDMNVHHPDHPGYDIRSTGPGDEEIRYIEVKGTDDRWDTRGVDVTKTQLRHALKYPDQSWLYVVEFARGPHAKIHRIRDFASKVERIAFDGGWRDFAEA